MGAAMSYIMKIANIRATMSVLGPTSTLHLDIEISQYVVTTSGLIIRHNFTMPIAFLHILDDN